MIHQDQATKLFSSILTVAMQKRLSTSFIMLILISSIYVCKSTCRTLNMRSKNPWFRVRMINLQTSQKKAEGRTLSFLLNLASDPIQSNIVKYNRSLLSYHVKLIDKRKTRDKISDDILFLISTCMKGGIYIELQANRPINKKKLHEYSN